MQGIKDLEEGRYTTYTIPERNWWRTLSGGVESSVESDEKSDRRGLRRNLPDGVLFSFRSAKRELDDIWDFLFRNR